MVKNGLTFIKIFITTDIKDKKVVSIFNIVFLIKKYLRTIVRVFQNRKMLQKVKHNLICSDMILEEKGYRDKQHYDYDNNEIHIYLKQKPLFIAKGASYKDGIVSLCFNNNLKDLLEASLTIYCWTCLLPGLENSKYQQYIRRCTSYVDSQQDTDYPG